MGPDLVRFSGLQRTEEYNCASDLSTEICLRSRWNAGVHLTCGSYCGKILIVRKSSCIRNVLRDRGPLDRVAHIVRVPKRSGIFSCGGSMSRPRFVLKSVVLFLFLLGIGALGTARMDARERPVKMSLLVNLADVNKEKAREFFLEAYDVADIRSDGSAEVIASAVEYNELLWDGYDVTVLIPDLDSHLVSRY